MGHFETDGIKEGSSSCVPRRPIAAGETVLEDTEREQISSSSVRRLANELCLCRRDKNRKGRRRPIGYTAKLRSKRGKEVSAMLSCGCLVGPPVYMSVYTAEESPISVNHLQMKWRCLIFFPLVILAVASSRPNAPTLPFGWRVARLRCQPCLARGSRDAPRRSMLCVCVCVAIKKEQGRLFRL